MLPTFVSPARVKMALNMVLQTKYEAMQEILPSVPEKVINIKQKESINQPHTKAPYKSEECLSLDLA